MKRYHNFIKKTAIDNDYREDCTKKDEYFKFWNTQTSKHNNWTSPQYYENRKKRDQALKDREHKRLSLAMRQKQLSDLLRREAIAHNAELRLLQDEGVDNIEKLRIRHQEVNERLASEHKAEAELKLYYQWRRDEPAVRVAESSQRGEFVREAWAEQLSARRAAEAALKAEEARQAEEARLIALREALELEDTEKARLEEERRLAQFNLEEAKNKLRENQIATERLRKEEAVANRLEQELFKLEKQRAETESFRKKDSLRAVLNRQAVFRLRQRAMEVQREIEEDAALLLRVQQASEQAAVQQQAQQQAREELARTLQAIALQAQKEASLAHHNANIFHEEAVRELDALEQRWQKERDSRCALLSSVLAERQAQAREMRERAAQQRTRLQQESEDLARLMEHQQLAKQLHSEAEAKAKEVYRKELDQQVAQKEQTAEAKRQQVLREEEERKQTILAESAKLDAELKKIIIGGRRRNAWL